MLVQFYKYSIGQVLSYSPIDSCCLVGFLVETTACFVYRVT